jgi:hypothetical protein
MSFNINLRIDAWENVTDEGIIKLGKAIVPLQQLEEVNLNIEG